MTIELDLPTANRLLDEAVAEKGADFVYENEIGMSAGGGADCFYTHDTDSGLVPGCLVGNVLARAGVDLRDLAKYGDGRYDDGRYDDDAISEASDTLLASLEGEGILTAPATVWEALAAAQSRQDAGEPWGRAVAYSRGEIKED